MLNGFNADLLEIISIVSFDLENRDSQQTVNLLFNGTVTDISLRALLLFTALNFRFHRRITVA